MCIYIYIYIYCVYAVHAYIDTLPLRCKQSQKLRGRRGISELATCLLPKSAFLTQPTVSTRSTGKPKCTHVCVCKNVIFSSPARRLLAKTKLGAGVGRGSRLFKRERLFFFLEIDDSLEFNRVWPRFPGFSNY